MIQTFLKHWGQPVQEAWLDSEREIINLEALKTRFLGNIDLLERVLTTFSRQLDADLEEFERAIQAADVEAAAFASHRIKGMSANVEAKHLYRDAALAEQRAREDSIAELPDSLQRMRMDQSRLTEVLAMQCQAAH